ncbi:MAG TPA: ATP-binding protein, partial [bacterium]|nr:ATP-binding protein [bacterium]
AEQCAVCHAGGAPLEDIEISDRARISKSKSGEGRVVSLTQAIYNEEGCYLMCHDHHPRDKKVLGLFDITMSLSDVDNKIAGIKRHLIILGVSSFIAIMTALAAMLYYFLIRPMTALLGGVRDVSAGNYNTRVPVYASDEFGRLSHSFNRMAEKLRKESGYRSFLTYDTVAPEIVNGDSISKRSPIAPGYVGRDPESGSTFEDIYSRINDETHMKLVRSVKLASLGQLSAGIAHEINNPLTAVLSYSSLLLERVEGEKEKKWLSVVVDETKRCRNIVAGLLEFSRQSTPEKTQTKINDVILRAISLVENQESFHNIKILKDLAPDLPELNVDRGQMHQVFMNLLINSADAMKGIGTVSVESRLSVVESKVAPPRSFVEVSFTDTGCGVPAENLERLFDPFFTTKGPTEGTGLGLSICFGIVKRHNGDITVKSVVGQGSKFCVKLPAEGVANA